MEYRLLNNGGYDGLKAGDIGELVKKHDGGSVHLLVNGKELFFTASEVEPIEDEVEQPDTLKEVVDWCKVNDKGMCITTYGAIYIAEDFKVEGKYSKHYCKDLLTHIRAPKLKQITPEQLAEMGYEIVNK